LFAFERAAFVHTPASIVTLKSPLDIAHHDFIPLAFAGVMR